MGDKVLALLEDNTSLVRDNDLFYLEMPLDKAGVWIADRQIDSRFNGTGKTQYDIYYRGKNKSQAIMNIAYLKDAVDALSGSDGVCRTDTGEIFKLTMDYQWDFLDKDSEGYYVFANVLTLL